MADKIDIIKGQLLRCGYTIRKLDNDVKCRKYIDRDLIIYYIDECCGRLKNVPTKYLKENPDIIDFFISKNKDSETFLLDFGLERFGESIRKQMINYYFKNIFPRFATLRRLSKDELIKYVFAVVPKSLTKEIPDSFKNQEYYSILFSRNKKIDDIPEEYRTLEMYRHVFLHDYDRDVTRVPEEFRTEKMYTKAYKDGKINFDQIPLKFLSQNLYNYYFSRELDLEKIPEEYINYSLFNFYLNQSMGSNSFDIYLVPEKNRSRKMYYVAYVEGIIKYEDIPSNFYSRDLCDKYFEDTFDLEKIPVSYYDQDKCNRYFVQTDYISIIPNKFINQNLFNYYYKYSSRDKSEIIRIIPERFRTKDMFYNADVIKNAIDIIPPEYKTFELFNYYFNTCNPVTFDITIIPLEYLNQEMCSFYYRFHSDNIDVIPEEFINDELLFEKQKRKTLS